MTQRTVSRGFGTTAATAALMAACLWGSTAHAGLESCGNIDVEAEAQCEVAVEGGCTARCTSDNLTLSCSAELYAECDTDCNGVLPECEVLCRGECTGSCEVEAGSFECEGSCKGRCDGECTGECEADDDQAACEASCKATCSGECSASCSGTPPSASCEGQCDASCEGECNARANFECQGVCQAAGSANCKSNLKDACEAQCKKPEGSVFCDGQYVDHGNNLEECVAALNAVLKVEVEASSSSSGQCSGNRCKGEAEAKASASCALQVPASSRGAEGLLALLGLAFLAAARRRNQTAR